MDDLVFIFGFDADRVAHMTVRHVHYWHKRAREFAKRRPRR